MKILHKYVLAQFLRTLGISILVLCLLFVIIDFFDRIDNILKEDASLLIAVQYFLYKVPIALSLTLPVSVLISCMLTFGLLSKNSEITAMRASGLSIFWIAQPVILSSLMLSVGAGIFQETVVPHYARRVREIYNLDIRKKDETGTYSQNDFWWRSGDIFYSVNTFDSRDNTLYDFTQIEINNQFSIKQRLDAESVQYVDPMLGWSMDSVTESQFRKKDTPLIKHYEGLPLQIPEKPRDFYDAKLDPQSMSFGKLHSFIKKQRENGIVVNGYLADLNAKISFPFVLFIVTLVVLPFSLLPARHGKMASSFIAGLVIGFSYYAVHSMSLAMGRAELWPPLLAAWMANILMGIVGMILLYGSESPS